MYTHGSWHSTHIHPSHEYVHTLYAYPPPMKVHMHITLVVYHRHLERALKESVPFDQVVASGVGPGPQFQPVLCMFHHYCNEMPIAG